MLVRLFSAGARSQTQARWCRPRRSLSTPTTTVGPTGKGFDITENVDKQLMQVRGYGDRSFQLNEVQVNQSVLLFRKSFLLWGARKFDDITVESLAPFALLHPTLEVLFVGCGDVQPRQLPPDVVQFFRAKGVVLEASSTVNAAATFNILTSEGRNVAAALLTLQPAEAEQAPLPSNE